MVPVYLIALARYEAIEQQRDRLLAPVDFGELPRLPDASWPMLEQLNQARDVAYRRVLEVEEVLSAEERALLKQMGLRV